MGSAASCGSSTNFRLAGSSPTRWSHTRCTGSETRNFKNLIAASRRGPCAWTVMPCTQYDPKLDRSPPSDRLGSGTTPHAAFAPARTEARSEEHTSELQSRYVISYAVFCLKKKKK